MLNIKATINGEDYKEVNISRETYSYRELKQAFKQEFVLSTDDEIEIYDNDNVEINDVSMLSNNKNKYKVAVLNRRYSSHSNHSGEFKDLKVEENKELQNVLKDQISKHKYSCYSKG